MSQDDKILQVLERGESLTPLDGFRLAGTLAMHSVAARLRARGYIIDCELVRVGRSNIGRYSLNQRIAVG